MLAVDHLEVFVLDQVDSMHLHGGSWGVLVFVFEEEDEDGKRKIYDIN